jgi:hypothetical protein
VVVDMLLRKIMQTLPNNVIRAFADDIALLSRNIVEESEVIKNIFMGFAEVSGLELNLGKTVVMPLWELKGEAAMNELGKAVKANDIKEDFLVKIGKVNGFWDNMQFGRTGKYLGFVMGPDKQELSWEKAALKFMERAKVWARIGEGLQFSMLAYNVFCFSVFGYVAQLEVPSEEVLMKEKVALRMMTPGPGSWITPP